jgi:hypothetical protein
LLEEIIASGGEETALRNGSAPVTSAAYALHRCGYGSCGTYLADQVDVTYVDA